VAQTPINLNRVRKNRARVAAKQTADANAVLHGLPKSEKAKAKAEIDATLSKLDAHKRITKPE
jgi:hypothetical protein